MERAKAIIVMMVVMVFILLGVAKADWIEGDPHKMHWPQLPDPFGWDVHASEPYTVADDFRCAETGWIQDIHFWGSWLGGYDPAYCYIYGFIISIHEDIPNPDPSDPTTYSMPGTVLLSQFYDIDNFVVAGPFYGEQGWYDPVQGLVLPFDHFEYFQYNLYLPQEDWVHQTQGNIYWLNISAIVADPFMYPWGWKTTFFDRRFLDTSVWTDQFSIVWNPIYDPYIGPYEHLDLAFVITGEPDQEPTVFPEIQTECPELPTWCPDNDPTVCQVTECPDNKTFCPIEPTICPTMETECPVVETECPLYGGTYCPVATTLCPKVETLCPEEVTLCPEFEPTFCPYIDTECFQDITWCPIQLTLCPDAPTECFPAPTICEVLTSCPDDPTWCPLGQFIPTVCPIEYTICPEIPTSCFPSEVTVCPYEFTFCPGDWTYCPLNPTYCPNIPTECPVVPTTCAIIETACGIVPTECPAVEVPTECPILDTFCPDNDPTICEITQCPVTDTLCPVDPTYCPLIDSDGDGVDDCNDNCITTPNPGQEDTYPPPSGNNCGDACECEGNFDNDQDQDGSDAAKFKADFGRSPFFRPCTNGDPCNGDFDCDVDVDGTDAALFKSDFGRSPFFNPCPICPTDPWCTYP